MGAKGARTPNLEAILHPLRTLERALEQDLLLPLFEDFLSVS